MFEILIIAVFAWLFFKSIGLAFRLAWGATKIVACILMVLALPALLLCLLFAGGMLLLLPLGLTALAFALLKEVF